MLHLFFCWPCAGYPAGKAQHKSAGEYVAVRRGKAFCLLTWGLSSSGGGFRGRESFPKAHIHSAISFTFSPWHKQQPNAQKMPSLLVILVLVICTLCTLRAIYTCTKCCWDGSFLCLLCKERVTEGTWESHRRKCAAENDWYIEQLPKSEVSL